MKNALLKMHLAVFLWGFTGVLGRAIELAEFPLVWYRTFITAIIFLGILLARKEFVKISTKELIQFAKAAQLSKDQQHIANVDPRRTIFEVGEYVLVEYQPSALVKGRAPNKLLPNLRGPFRVHSREGDRYRLTSLIDGKEGDVHLARLHPYHFDPRHTSPRDAAMRDVLTLFDIEEVLDHSGDGKLRSQMVFVILQSTHTKYLTSPLILLIQTNLSMRLR
jgi:hypothetical protein